MWVSVPYERGALLQRCGKALLWGCPHVLDSTAHLFWEELTMSSGIYVYVLAAVSSGMCGCQTMVSSGVCV